MKITNLKATMAKIATVGLLAGAVVLAAPQKAEAQVRFGVGVNFGGPVVYRHHYYAPPVVYAPPVYGYGYYHPHYGYYGYRHYGWDHYHHGYGGYYR